MRKVVDILHKGWRYLTDANYRFAVNGTHFDMYHEMSDEEYLKLQFLARVGYELDLSNPKMFSEKLQWLKIHDRRPEYTVMVDKYEVKAYVAEKIGEQYTVPTLGVWEHFDDIKFELLPDQFVLKCTHDSGSIIKCTNKKTFNYGYARKQLERKLARNYYYYTREWPYKNVHPRIIAEPFLKNGDRTREPQNGKLPLLDYKFYCFNGKPRFLYISEGLDGDHKIAKMNFLTLDWKLAPFQRTDFLPFDRIPQKVNAFHEMVELSEQLCKNIFFVRVDWLVLNEQFYFSEFTFTPGSGFEPFSPVEFEEEIGKMIEI